MTDSNNIVTVCMDCELEKGKQLDKEGIKVSHGLCKSCFKVRMLVEELLYPKE